MQFGSNSLAIDASGLKIGIVSAYSETANSTRYENQDPFHATLRGVLSNAFAGYRSTTSQGLFALSVSFRS